jgi:GAF domain-containing protein
MTIAPRDAVWNALTRLSQLPLGQETVNGTLQRIASGAVTLFDAVQHAGVTVAHDSRPNTDAATGGVVYEVDSFQYDVGHGPCLHALLTGELTEIPCMAGDQRWPAYAEFAAARGIGSSLSLPMTVAAGVTLEGPVVSAPAIAAAVGDGRVGVINFYAAREGRFTDEERQAARWFAEQAAVTLANARLFAAAQDMIGQLQAAMASRAVIEQAKGMIMARHHLSADDAFARLRDDSQRRNVKLRDLASGLVSGAGANGSAPGRTDAAAAGELHMT